MLVSANKPAIYPELIPRRYLISPKPTPQVDALAFMETGLKELGIPLVNIPSIFQNAAPHVERKLFAPTGTHWNELGSCLALAELAKTIRNVDPNFDGSLTCEVKGERVIPLTMDRDLLSVANVWFPKWLIQPTQKVRRELVVQPEEKRESILFVGTSFLWALFHHLDKASFFSERDMYYYFKRSVPFPRGKQEPIKKNDPKWLMRALRHRYVVLEVNQAFLHRLGHGFPKRFIAHRSSNH